MRYLPALLEVGGSIAVLLGIAVVLDPWIAVIVGGVIGIAAGYVLELREEREVDWTDSPSA